LTRHESRNNITARELDTRIHTIQRNLHLETRNIHQGRDGDWNSTAEQSLAILLDKPKKGWKPPALSLDPAKSSRTASCRTRWIYLPDGFYHGLVKSKRFLATDRIAIAAQARFAAVLAENNLRGVLVCMLVSAKSRAITTPG
jgi:hypothetical protein